MRSLSVAIGQPSFCLFVIGKKWALPGITREQSHVWSHHMCSHINCPPFSSATFLCLAVQCDKYRDWEKSTANVVTEPNKHLCERESQHWKMCDTARQQCCVTGLAMDSATLACYLEAFSEVVFPTPAIHSEFLSHTFFLLFSLKPLQRF